jgi:hypothetical protein
MVTKMEMFGSDIHMFVHRNIVTNYTQQDATFLNLFILTDAVHVSGGFSAHHQEHITARTASGIVNQYCCLLLPWKRWKHATICRKNKQSYFVN